MTQLFIGIVCTLILAANAAIWGDEYGAGWNWCAGSLGVAFSVMLFIGGYLIGGGK